MSDASVSQHGPVHVHRFNKPQAVTIGSSGWAFPSCQLEVLPDSSAKTSTNIKNTSPRFTEEQLSHNGNKLDDYFWSQDKQQVILSIPVPANTRAKAIQVVTQKDSIKVKLNGYVLVEGKTALPINIDDDYTDWELTDWERSEPGRRLLRVTLVKLVPAGGVHVVMWWPKLFDTEPAIDVDQIADRDKNFMEHRQVWQSAHQQFREQLCQQEPNDVVTDSTL